MLNSENPYNMEETTRPMIYLLTKTGLQALENFFQEPVLLAFDFDGTIARLVKDPNKAALNVTTRKQLKEISALAPVLILSGRGKSDLLERLPDRYAYLVGNHGIEGARIPPKRLLRLKKVCSRWRPTLERKSAAIKGVYVEDKTYSFSLHYRGVKNPAATRKALIKACEILTPQPRIILGKFVINVVPPQAVNKGDALIRILKLAGIKRAIFFGDDDTDEDVFRLTKIQLFSVRIDKKTKSAAKYFLRDQREINHVLKIVSKLLSDTSQQASFR